MPSSGRFQSRVLSEISRQSLKLRDRLERLVRHTRMAATWTAQVLLYPIYVGFQSLRMASRQLSQASHSPRSPLKALVAAFRRVTGQPTSPPAKPLSASTPIFRALAAVEELGLPLALPLADEVLGQLPSRQSRALPGTLAMAKGQGSSAVAAPTVTVRALASSLETRSLVLISPENEVLDVLTPDQHDFLRRRIADALADYWRDRRELTLAEARVLPLPPPLISDNLLAPVKWFYQLMTWEQRSAVAIAVDLFQEATLAFYFSTLEKAELAALPHEPVQNSQALIYSPSRWPVVAAGPGALLSQEPEPSETALVSATGQGTVIPHSRESTTVSTQINNALQPYIETQAQLVAYEQHPLERLLQWLDRGMLWLENQVTRLQHWWKQFQR
ncbi:MULTISPECIES: hypothetical protein [unclassified Leptolyngbya]|uniref:hypothetical protein n=1 Tax=unclassified Leptolyngbya TaxID=2650499 RepID=UPI00168A3381|nr:MULTISPECIES: hypothetical protein [unclassified Leptolyngbya]MBD1910375.1 hypothetical protein [Leptolyngbya sp. FACHB-8]MBD2155303.1 hypothetical protein [Leptolyngbya sp. FACHB-16]